MTDVTVQLDPVAPDRQPSAVAMDRAPIFGSQPLTEPPRPDIASSGHEGGDGASISRRRWLLEWVVIVSVATVLALVLKFAVISSFEIPSGSMTPTLQPGDRVLVNRLSYDAHELRRGDVVVFGRPKNAPQGDADAPKDLIKRVIALEGETVETRGDDLYVDGRRLVEPYLTDGTPTQGIEEPVLIPAGHIWVMGDNRTNSADSRVFGPLDEDLVLGRAFSRVWPPSRLGYL